jgi:hypothetical protein
MFNHFRNLFDQPVFRYATALFIFSLTVNLVFLTGLKRQLFIQTAMATSSQRGS